MKLLGLVLAGMCAFYTVSSAEADEKTKKKPPTAKQRLSEFFCFDVTCLIAAMNEANTRGGVNVINLEAGSYRLASVDNVVGRPGGNGLPAVTSELTINGVDADATVIERDPAAPRFRIFYVAAGGNLTLNGLAIRGGAVSGGGIWNDGTLHVNYSIIEANQFQGGSGAGIFNNSILSVTHSIIGRNSSQEGSGVENGSSASAALTDVSIVDNFAAGGAGINNFGTMTVQNSTIIDNAADVGGGIRNLGRIEIKNTTIAENVARGGGAGIFTSGQMKIINSTIARNTVVGLFGSGVGGGGIAGSGFLDLQNSILALNTVTDPRLPATPDCFGPITSLGNNIIGELMGCGISLTASDQVTDPGLGNFIDDETPGGGRFPLLANSPAIDRGNNNVCSVDAVLNTDQLGHSRVGPCDIGAIEFEGALTIVIDVRPRRYPPSRLNVNSTRNINVALLSAGGFDATLIDTSRVRFGATGSEAAPVHTAQRDVNGDGQRDHVLRFRIQDLGVQCGASDLTLTGRNPDGHPISGSSPIITTGCRQR